MLVIRKFFLSTEFTEDTEIFVEDSLSAEFLLSTEHTEDMEKHDWHERK